MMSSPRKAESPDGESPVPKNTVVVLDQARPETMLPKPVFPHLPHLRQS